MVSAMASPMPPEPAAGFPADPAAFDELTQWRVLRVEARHDALVTHSALGDPLRLDTERVRELSGFRLEIELRRRTIATIEKNFLPIGLMTLIMFTSLWFPPALVRDKVAVALASTLSGAVLLASINNQLGNVGYTIAVEYAFYVFFALAVLCIVAVLLAERLRVVKQEGLALRTERAMRVVFVLTVAGTAFAGWFAANH
jgi:branched-chain amino acid transport system substrate-binding protein